MYSYIYIYICMYSWYRERVWAMLSVDMLPTCAFVHVRSHACDVIICCIQPEAAQDYVLTYRFCTHEYVWVERVCDWCMGGGGRLTAARRSVPTMKPPSGLCSEMARTPSIKKLMWFDPSSIRYASSTHTCQFEYWHPQKKEKMTRSCWFNAMLWAALNSKRLIN